MAERKRIVRPNFLNKTIIFAKLSKYTQLNQGIFNMSEHLTRENPMGTDGLDFVVFASKAPEKLYLQLKKLGFRAVAKHRAKQVTLYQQGHINFFISQEQNSLATESAKQHGTSIFAMGFKVKDANYAFERAIKLGAKPYYGDEEGFNIPAIYGVGGSLVYLVDHENATHLYEYDFLPWQEEKISVKDNDVGLIYIDHLAHNIHRGTIDKWTAFYQKLFNFHEIRYFNISGKMTGLKSRAISSPCGKILIPLNESSDDKSQIEEFLREYHGEGVQHIALTSENIYETAEKLLAQNVSFLEVPDTYYEMVEKRLPNHDEDLARLKKDHIMIDGTTQPKSKLLLQVFTQPMLGPIFFEIIQRKGNEGLGEDNLQALFEAMELDQIRRGTLGYVADKEAIQNLPGKHENPKI